jgi:glycerol-3-phosphate dehydrogenase
MWSQGWRDKVWSALRDGKRPVLSDPGASDPGSPTKSWDVIVVGGGITGAGIVAEAARIGLKALLVEAQDFASGTSSRSTKLVHGGLRYLRQGRIGLTRESVVEREKLMSEARGLVRPLGFWLTTFEGDKMPGWMFGLGLAMYDALAGKWAHEKHGAAELLQRVPSLGGAKVRGGYHYFDAQTDDARLVLRVLREAVARGAVAINYARATDLLRTQDGRVRGVVIEDVSGGPSRSVEVEATVVINATGAWADGLRMKLGAHRRLRPIRGSHLVLAGSRLPLGQAISMLHPRDGRAVFAIPWEGSTIVGTTDVDHTGDMWTEPAISDDERGYILESLRHAFPRLDLGERDVRATWAGVRGTIDTGASDPSKESREHALWEESGLLTVTGGKLTTFRVMALETLRAARKQLPAVKQLQKRSRILNDLDGDSLSLELDPTLRERMLGRHGIEAKEILAAPEGTETIADTPVLWSELRFAARDEAVVHLEDLLLRRARIGLLAERGGMGVMDRIRRIAQPELGWDDATWEREEAAYGRTWNAAYRGYGSSPAEGEKR